MFRDPNRQVPPLNERTTVAERRRAEVYMKNKQLINTVPEIGSSV